MTRRTSSRSKQANVPTVRFSDLTIFDGFEVHGVKTVDHLKDGRPVFEQCDDPEAEFFSLYGHYDPTDFNNGVPYANVGLDWLLDFPNREEAEKAQAYFEHFREGQLRLAKPA